MSFGQGRLALAPSARRDDTCGRYKLEDSIDHGNDIGAAVGSSRLSMNDRAAIFYEQPLWHL